MAGNFYIENLVRFSFEACFLCLIDLFLFFIAFFILCNFRLWSFGLCKLNCQVFDGENWMVFVY
jgi:hypothetical protein